jgi:spore maturation protein CgeB
MKVPMVLSPMDSYKEWTHGETCLKPKNNTVKEWVDDITWMINHKADRELMAKKAYEQVVRNHDIKRHIYERAEQYEAIHKEVQERRAKNVATSNVSN